MVQEKTKKNVWAMPKAPPKYLWRSGELVAWDEATVHMSMMAWTSISMVFEGIRGYWHADEAQLNIFKLDAHLQRLFQSMKIMRMTSRWSREELVQSVLELVRANAFKSDIYVQPLAYFGDGTPGYLSMTERPGEIALFSRLTSSILGTGKVVSCGVSSWTRLADNVMPPRAKAIANYQNSRYVADEADRHGYDFGIILNAQGKVSEISYACLYLIRDGVAVTPPVTAGILESITRVVVKELLEKELGVPVVERDIDRTELYVADEAFVCGTGAEIQIIGSVDGYRVGDGQTWPLASRLEALYHNIVRGQDCRYAAWRTTAY